MPCSLWPPPADGLVWSVQVGFSPPSLSLLLQAASLTGCVLLSPSSPSALQPRGIPSRSGNLRLLSWSGNRTQRDHLGLEEGTVEREKITMEGKEKADSTKWLWCQAGRAGPQQFSFSNTSQGVSPCPLASVASQLANSPFLPQVRIPASNRSLSP